MRTDANSETANQRRAFEAMAFDILGNVLNTAESPAALSIYLTEQLREMTGARTVILLQCVHDSDAGGHRLVAVNPERDRSLAESAEVGRLTGLSNDLRSSTVWGPDGRHNGAEEVLAALGCGLSIAVPLRVGATDVGVMLLLDLPDAHGIDSVVEVLDMLSTVVALIFRNAVLYEEQEAMVEARTREMAQANQALQDTLVEREQAEKALRFTQFSLDRAADAAFWMGPDARFSYVNDAACRSLGYSREELLSMTVHDIDPDFPHEAWPDHWREVKERGSFAMESHHRTKDGQVFPVEIIANFVEFEGQEYNCAFARDITERRQAEEKIRHRNEELAALNAIASATSKALDIETILRATLRQVVAVAGVDGAECHLQDSTGDLVLAGTWGLDDAFVAASQDYRFPPGTGIPGRTFARRAPVYAADAPTDERYLRRAEAGAAGYRSLLCVPILGRESLLGTFMLYSRPPREFAPEVQTLLMTVGGQLAVALERARLRAHLQAYAAQLEQRVAERTIELEAFTYSVSHDLRAPLRAIDGFAQALQEDYAGELDAEGQHYLKRLRAGSQQMGQLIDDLLHLSRVSRQELKRRPLDLAAMARQAFEDLAPYRAGREIDFRVSACPPAHGDARLMALVVHNLLSNAIKFTRERDTAIIEIGYQTEGAEPAYFVRDNGVGFDMAYAGKLFAPFHRLHRAEDYPGTGIGLAIVHRVIHRHAGRVWVEAGVDQGATFYFTI